MKTINLIILAVMLMLGEATAQELPQFIVNDFDGWNYNNPGIELNAENIGGSKIALYVDEQGRVLKLWSSLFSCQGMDSITAQVYWYMPHSKQSDFVLSLTALTLAIDNAQGAPIDSVTVTAATAATSSHILNFSIPIPHEIDSISMRLVSWHAKSPSFGIVRRALFQAVTASTEPPLAGDIDGDGSLSVSDVTRLIGFILNWNGTDDITPYDVDQDGSASVSDVTQLIAMILSK